jgi:hypothetical protein
MAKSKNVRAANMWPENPIVLRMIEKNQPLSQWKAFMETGDQSSGHYHKDHKKIAAAIYRQLTHPDARVIVAHEWDDLGPEIRMTLGALAEKGDGSNNVTKGCQYLNEKVGGRLLRKRIEQTTSVGGRIIRIDPAKAGAIRKHQLDDPRFKIAPRR